MARYTTKEWVKIVKEKWNYDYDYSKVDYKGSKEKVCIICNKIDVTGNIHGEFWQEANSHKYHGKGCPKCANLLKTTSLFINEAKQIHGNKYDYSKVKYIHSKEKVEIVCKKHGSFWQTPSNHLRGLGCPLCNTGFIHKKEQETWIKQANKTHNGFYDYSLVNYTSCNAKVTIICPIHGEFEQIAYSHIQGKGCPRCILKSQNKVLLKLKESFPDDEFLWEYTCDWLEKQRIDIFMPKYNIGIEYHGEQHYIPIKAWGGQLMLEETKRRDRLKLEKCKQNNVVLFYLKYDYTENDFNTLINNIRNKIK